jgi:hypothetical protein
MMAVILNGVAQLEYDRDKPLPPHQELYLDKMDQQMDEGIQLGDELVPQPDLGQRAQFVAGNLAHAILNDQESAASALCTYLANRLPDLKQVKIDNSSGDIAIELVFDEDYKKQVPVQFLH